MTDKPMNDNNTELINQILEIELEWFLTVNPDITAECQRHPKAFKLMRRSNFATWSPSTLKRYLSHLQATAVEGRNLVREKYAKMQSALPCENDSLVLNDIVKTQEIWQQAVRREHPAIFGTQTESAFTWYLRCELDTYSPEVLESYLNDIEKANAGGRNLITETYDHLARGLGYKSLDEWHRQRVSTQQPNQSD